MNIAFLVVKDILNGGGIEHYTRQVGRRLVERGHQVTVYSTKGAQGTGCSFEGMRVIYVPRLRPHWAEKLGAACGAALHQLSTGTPDVIHLHSVASGAMAGVLRLRHIPCVVQMHGIEWQRSRWSKLGCVALKNLECFSFRYADAFTAVSHVQCQFYSDRFGVPVRFIPTASELKERVEPDLIRNASYKPGRYVLSASRLVPEKGIHYLIEAFKRLPTDWHLVIAGTGVAAYAAALRQLAGQDPRIHFTGYVKGKMLDELFSNAGLYAQPSELEGLSIALLEGMSFGLPCLVSDIPENQEAIGDSGLTFRSKDVADLAGQLNWAITNPEPLARLGRKARERVRRIYSWDSVTDSLESFYHDVVVSTKRSLLTKAKVHGLNAK